MSKFEVGDRVVCPVYPGEGEVSDGTYFHPKMKRLVGKEMVVEDHHADGTVMALGWYWIDEWLEPAEDRSTWHPHHDAIVAWAKGAKIEVSEDGGTSWRDATTPTWKHTKDFRVKAEPDHSEEIADIERKMRELSEVQNELADRLEALR